jgi:tetratricopeptide (TPR) repeat protein
MMGGIYRNIEEWDSSLECFNKILQINPYSQVAVLNLLEIYRAKGMYDKASSLLEDRRDLFPNRVEYLRLKARIFLTQGKINPALNNMETAFSLDPDYYLNSLLLGNIYHSNRDFLKAEMFYKKLLEFKDSYTDIEARFWLGKLYMLQGKLSKSRKEFESGIEKTKKMGWKYWQSTFTVLLTHINLVEGKLDKAFVMANRVIELSEETNLILYKSKALHFLGLTYLRMGMREEAEKAAEKMRMSIKETGYLKLMRHYYHLIGMIALEKNQISEAITNFKMAVETLPFQRKVYDEHTFFMDALAFSYLQNGDLEYARKSYERIITLTTGMLTYSDVYTRGFYQLGKIYQQMNINEKAIDCYRIFLSLWEEADIKFLEIDDAKKQLGQLEKKLIVQY